MRTAAAGILGQFLELGGVVAVALCDREGRMIASAGDRDATVALASAVAKLLRTSDGAESLFEDQPEFTVLREGSSSVSLHVRRVGDDWTLAAAWTDDGPVDVGDGMLIPRPELVRRYAAETATRLQAVS